MDTPSVASHHDLTGAMLRARREELGMGQKEFWAPAEVEVATASNYETGTTKKIPGAVKKLMFQAYYQE